MAKKTILNEVASAIGAAAARMETSKPKRSTGTKHAKAKTVPEAAPVVDSYVVEEPVVEQAQAVVDHSEIAKVAYLRWEARGGHGGSPEEDWITAERELLAKASAR